MDVIAELKQGALEAYRKYGILPSLTLAQAILESNWGKSAPGYNLFGIKWTVGCGYDYQLLWTRECYNGDWQRVKAKFRKYNSYEESIKDHSTLFVRLSRYDKVLTATNYDDACNAVQKAGYATDPEYAHKLISLIEKFNLNRWDMEGYGMYKDFDKVSDWAKPYVEEAKKLGLMVGDPEGAFRPKDNATREEVAKIAIALYKKG